MKYLKRKDNDLKYHEFVQFSGHKEDLEDILKMTTCTITEISDFIFDEESSYINTPKAFSVSYSAIDGDHKFTVIQGDYISSKNNFTVIRKSDFEKEYVPSKYHMLREELFKQLRFKKEAIKRIEEQIRETKEDDKSLPYLKENLYHLESVYDLFKSSIHKIRTINIEE